MFLIACVFLAGLCRADSKNPVFSVLILLIALAISLKPLRLRQYRSVFLWNILLVITIAGAVFRYRAVSEERQTCRKAVTEGETVTVCGTLKKKEYKNEKYRYYLGDAYLRVENNQKNQEDQEDQAGEETAVISCQTVLLYYDTDDYQIGDLLRVEGEAGIFDEATNEGMFDLREYYASQKVYFFVYPQDTEFITSKGIFARIWGSKAGNGVSPDAASENASAAGGKVGSEVDSAAPVEDGSAVSAENEKQAVCRSLGEAIYRLRNHLAEGLSAAVQLGISQTVFFRETDAGMFSSMLLGDKSQLDAEIKDLYKSAGISHLLAISGLHISLLGMTLYKLLRKHGAGFAASGTAAGTFTILYTQMTGSAVSTERAAGMMLLTMVGAVIGRQTDLLNSLGIMALGLLWDNPFLIYNSGFIFTMTAMIGITVTGKVFGGNITEDSGEKAKIGSKKKSKTDAGRLAERQSQIASKSELKNWSGVEEIIDFYADLKAGIPTLVEKQQKNLWQGLALTLTTLPVVASYYYEIPVYSFLLNLLVLPLSGILIGSGALGILTASQSVTAGMIFLTPGAIILRIYEFLCSLCLKLPGAMLITGQPALGKICCYYLLLAAGTGILYLFREKSAVSAAVRPFLAAGLLCMLLFPGRQGFEIDVLDVGQGDGTFLRTEDGVTFFIDGGSTSETEVGKYRILPFLKSKGIRSVDYWLITHSDTDHISGAEEVLASGYQIKNLVLSAYMPDDEGKEALLELAEEADIPVLYLKPGDEIDTKTASFRCVYPDSGAAEAFEDVNNLSLTMLYEEDGFTGLFAGDIPEEAESLLLQELEQSGKLGSITNLTFYKVNHHGSKYSSSSTFMETISPDLASISCAIKNKYGHPAEEAIERIADTGCRIFYTMNSGEIRLIREGKERKIVVKTFLSN